MEIKEYFSRVRRGDKEAFAYIYNELKSPVFTIACRIVQSKEAAEDITHDVFVRLFASPPDPTVKNPRAWVFQITRNLAIDVTRAKQSVSLDDVQLSAEDDFDDTLIRLDIETAICRLPREEREILSLHLNGLLGFSEIAHIVGLSLPAVYRKYRKAIGTLQKYLGGAL